MPSEPPRTSSSSSRPSSSSSAAKPSSSSKESSSSSRPSGSSSSSSKAPSSGDAKPPVSTPVISANAWMSFFLFCCLVLIILQAPLGLNASGGVSTIFGLPAVPWGAAAMPMVGGIGGMTLSGMPGCAGMVAGMVPWCHSPQIQAQLQMQAYAQPQIVYTNASPMIPQQPQQPQQIIVEAPRQQRSQRDHQMGGQGQIATPGAGAGWSWYANNDGTTDGEYRRNRDDSTYRQMQYQRPGVQVQVTQSRQNPDQQQHQYTQQAQVQGHQPQQVPRVQVAMPASVQPMVSLPPAAAIGLANLENAFYPLLIGAIALLVLFDYAS